MSTLPLLLAAVLATNGVNKAESLARITSDTTYYDRKEGIAVFKGHVHVGDSDYQMDARRAIVFMTPSNTLSRIAATGAVALTNGTKRAYGEKVTYHRDNGLIVLHGAEGAPALVLDESPEGDRSVRGRKIRFWINREQVEVVEADLSAPKPAGKKGGFSLPGMGK